MKDRSSSSLSTTIKTKSSKGRNARPNILELHYNRSLPAFIKVVDFKEFKLKQIQEKQKNDDSDINVLLIEDLDLRDILKSKEFPEKGFNIVNRFLKIEEEDLIMNEKNNILNSKSSTSGDYNYTTYNNNDVNDINENNDNNINKDKPIENDEEDLILNQINNKLFKDDEFQPGLFTSFDFKDKVKALIHNSLLLNTKVNFNVNQNLNKLNAAFSTDSNYSGEIKMQSEIDNSFVLNTCFTDKDIVYDNIVINFDQDAKKEKKETSVSEDRKLEFELFKKSEAIPEYENQIKSYQNLNYIQKQQEITILPEEDEVFNRKIFEYFVRVSKEIKDDGLKNKVKLILKLIMYRDQKTQKYIFSNKTKNQILNYWKNKYQKELSEATFREKNKILQEKYENESPSNKLLEMSKKLADKKRKSNARRLFGDFSSTIGSRLKKLYTRYAPTRNSSSGKPTIRRFSTEIKSQKNQK